jgi:nucleoid-associated protein YgaU
MPNDAKLGLVIGIGLVIIIAVVFFRKDPAAARESPEQPAAAAVNPPGILLKHTVKEGETLFSLAQRYYKDGTKFVEIYRANQAMLREPDRLEPGTDLVIPGVKE